ncbi:MAG TPA: hypothetical protein VMX16_10575 [Terriglobia bacterium]|nr:hypothetical protein [Terriglobia bacterium]
MSGTRDFTKQEGPPSPVRNIEDAPQGMRQELIDLAWNIAKLSSGRIDPDGHLYYVIEQSLGFQAAGNPMSGMRQRAGRDVESVDWPRVYDLIGRLWHEFRQVRLHEHYRNGANRILAGYGAAWDLGDDGRLHRVLPAAAQEQVSAAIAELDDPQFASARALFNAAGDAYDDRPRRDRDACANVFDAMESVAKVRYGFPDATFGQVVAQLRRAEALNGCIISLLESINGLRNRNFGHGMTTTFNLTPVEVDFTYLACIGAILVFCRAH